MRNRAEAPPFALALGRRPEVPMVVVNSKGDSQMTDYQIAYFLLIVGYMMLFTLSHSAH